MNKLYFIMGPMNAGKSLHLLAKAHNFEERNIPFMLLKPNIDNRDGVNVIHSRALGSKECLSVDIKTNILKFVEDEIINSRKYYKWILVDESQFLTKEQVDQLSDVVDKLGINVICYGLRSDFRGELFEGSKRLFEIADSIEELKCSCECGNKALINARFDKNGNIIINGSQIEIGGNDKYISICRKCYKNKIKNLIVNNE